MMIPFDGLGFLVLMILVIFGLGWCAGVWHCDRQERNKLREEKRLREQKEKEEKESKVYLL